MPASSTTSNAVPKQQITPADVAAQERARQAQHAAEQAKYLRDCIVTARR